MSKEDVIDYVMTTPSNPNRAVLSGMLDEVSGTQLPSPTASDNGKVLGVDGGEYKLVEQSGGSVEVIKIGESSTGTSDTSAPFIFNGTITGIDGNQLAEQIGDKSVIGFKFRNLKGMGSNKPFSTMGSVTGNAGTIDLLMNKQAIKYVTQINFIAYFQFARPNDAATIEVYAICI